MDIIAAHQQGLIEQLEDEVRALAGRPQDYAQRAVVLHHLFSHSRQAHEWALFEARRQLAVFRAVSALTKRLGRWRWLTPNRDSVAEAVKALDEALGKALRARCAAAYRAYRISAAPALQAEAERELPVRLVAALRHCHEARRSAESLDSEALGVLRACSEQLAASAIDQEELESAWAKVEAAGFKRIAHGLLGARALERSAERDRKRDPAMIERELLRDPLLPPSFRSNPAQHFYELQFALADRRRRQWRETCDRDPGAFELAA